MSEDPSSSRPSSAKTQEKSWLDKLLQAFSVEPQSREELLDIIKDAANNSLLDQEAVNIIEGAMDVSSQQVREVMIPRSQMVVLNVNESPIELLPKVIESGHSRFPVVGEGLDDIRGILLAKDLLPLILSNSEEEFRLENILRVANIVPESKRLNILLREFREKRYHMALVLDEYGSISGLVTIEDVLEEIVGEIEDETDDEGDDGFIRQIDDNDFIIKALTPIEDFNEHFGSAFSDNEFDTIGGLLMQAFGHLPERNETAELDGYHFKVLYSDNRQIHLLRLNVPTPQTN